MNTDYDNQATAFLTKNGLKMRITLSDTKAPHWEPSGHHYRVTLWRNRDHFCPGAWRLTFDFWGSQHDAATGQHPSEYDVLACISADAHCPDTFDDFCAEYGDDVDSIKALQTFRRADRFAKRLRAFFTEAELSELGEIR